MNVIRACTICMNYIASWSIVLIELLFLVLHLVKVPSIQLAPQGLTPELLRGTHQNQIWLGLTF